MPFRFPPLPFLVFTQLVIFAFAAFASTPLRKITACRLVPTAWADGDSFQVRTPKGENYTVRLYGADCLEATANDATDARRLRAQRRYFGITRIDPDPGTSIEIAKEFGKKAKSETSDFLKDPFDLYTTFADARGDGRYQRIYAFVVRPDGRDLAAHLVAQGLARAYGVCRESYDGSSQDDYREKLRDLELQAAKRGKGVWSLTDWEALPGERLEQRQEDAETRLAIEGRSLTTDQRINPNTAARVDLMRLPGIGETYANRIIEGRPYAQLDDLRRIQGIGPATLEKITPFLSLDPDGEGE